MRIVVIASLSLFVGSAMAAPTRWDLSNFKFDDGGSATGYFSYDAVTNIFSDWNILVNGGNPIDPINFRQEQFSPSLPSWHPNGRVIVGRSWNVPAGDKIIFGSESPGFSALIFDSTVLGHSGPIISASLTDHSSQYTFEYDPQFVVTTHTLKRSTRGVFINASTSRPPTSLFLDFGSDINRKFIIKTKKSTGEEYYADEAGTTMAASFTAPQRQAIVNGVQAIFDRSSIPIHVTDSKPNRSSLTVQFAKPLTPFDDDGNKDTPKSPLFGSAYDVVPIYARGQAIDRFDRRKDGNVAVFLSPDTSPISSIVETVAHEAAHGYGVRHIDTGNCAEVMDNCVRLANPSFSEVVSKISDPPTTNGLFNDDTHNPSYHLRRYAANQSDSEIGLPFGTWDKGFITNRVFDVAISDLTVPIKGLEVGFSGGFGNLGGLGYSSTVIAENLIGNANITFTVAGNDSFDIIGFSSDSSIIDIFYIPNDGALANRELDASTNFIGTGRLMRYDLENEVPLEIGKISWSVSEVTQVPEPANLFLLVTGLSILSMKVARERKSCQAAG